MKYLIFFFMVSALQLNAQNQPKIERLIKAVELMPDDTLKVGQYGTLHEQLMFSNPELAKDYALREFHLAKKINYPKGITCAYLHFGNYFYNQTQLDSAEFYYNKALQQLESMQDGVLLKIFAYHSLAALEKDRGNYDKALELVGKNIDFYEKHQSIKSFHSKTTFNLIGAEYELIGQINILKGHYNIALRETLKALRFFEEKKDTLRTADALNQLGRIEYNLQHYTSGVDYCKQAYKIYKDFDDKFYQSTAARQLGDLLIELKQFDEAEQYFQNALALAKTIKAKNSQAQILSSLGVLYFKQKKYRPAKDYLQASLKIHDKLTYKKDASDALNNLAKIEIATKNWSGALNYLNKSIAVSKAIGAETNLSEAYLSRSVVYENLNRPNLAFSDFKAHKITNDSIFNMEKAQHIEELRIIYASEKKEQQIVIQQNEIDLLEAENKTRRLQGILLGLALLLSLVLFYALLQKMKRNKVEKEKIVADLEFKSKELTAQALHIAKKNEVLLDLKNNVETLKESTENDKGYRAIIRRINFDLKDDDSWETFSQHFQQIHKDFNHKILQEYPTITANDLRFMSLIKLNLSSKEIANILHVSPNGIKKARQRLRKKLQIPSDVSLEATIISI